MTMHVMCVWRKGEGVRLVELKRGLEEMSGGGLVTNVTAKPFVTFLQMAGRRVWDVEHPWAGRYIWGCPDDYGQGVAPKASRVARTDPNVVLAAWLEAFQGVRCGWPLFSHTILSVQGCVASSGESATFPRESTCVPIPPLPHPSGFQPVLIPLPR